MSNVIDNVAAATVAAPAINVQHVAQPVPQPVTQIAPQSTPPVGQTVQQPLPPIQYVVQDGSPNVITIIPFGDIAGDVIKIPPQDYPKHVSPAEPAKIGEKVSNRV